MTESERLLSAFSQVYFFEELVQDNLQYTDQNGNTKELADLILNLGNYVVAIQIKERSEADRTRDSAIEQKWFDDRMRTAKRQIKNTVDYIRQGALPAFKNKRGVNITVRSDAEIIPLVVFMNESITDYPHILEKHTDEGMTVNCMSLPDFQIMCSELVSPAEMIDYLEYRHSFYEKNGPVNYLFYKASETDMIISHPTKNEALIHQFLAEKYGVEEVRKGNTLFDHFRWFIQQTAERSTVGRDHEATFTILLFFAHFRRNEIRAFWDRLVLAKDKAQVGEYDIVGSIRRNDYVVFFVASAPNQVFSMDYLLEKARQKCNPTKLMQVYVWWEDAENYHIDYLYWSLPG